MYNLCPEQLTTETYGEAVSNLTDAIVGTENSETSQSDEVLESVSNYLTTLATFVNASDVIVDRTVGL